VCRGTGHGLRQHTRLRRGIHGNHPRRGVHDNRHRARHAAGHLVRWHDYRTLDFTNITSTSCTLYGYPGVSFVAAIGGNQIGAAASRSPASKLLVVLAPGKKAHAVLDLLDVLNFPASKCAATDAHWIKVYPPNQFSASYVAWTAKVCSKPNTVYLSVAPVRHGG
jgi:hypothetical protein